MFEKYQTEVRLDEDVENQIDALVKNDGFKRERLGCADYDAIATLCSDIGRIKMLHYPRCKRRIYDTEWECVIYHYPDSRRIGTGKATTAKEALEKATAEATERLKNLQDNILLQLKYGENWNSPL